MNNQLIWDTTLDPLDYPKEIREEFFKKSFFYRKKFVSWLDIISKDYINNFDWWIKLPSSRDPFKSNLYKNVIIFSILQNKKILKNVKIIYFENKNFIKIIRNNKIFKMNKTKIRLKNKIYYLNSFINSIIFSFLVLIFVRFFKKKSKKKDLKHFILVNNYIDTKLNVKDHVFSGLKKNFKNKKNTFFVPNFLFNRNLINLFKNIKNLSKENYLFKENYISLTEFICSAFDTFFNYRQFKVKKFRKFIKIDFSLLIFSELKSKKNFFTEFQSKLQLKFIEKLKINKFYPAKIIGRFENQNIDRAWFYGFKTFFPKTKSIGYQDFLYYPHLPNQSPTNYEFKANLIPDKIVMTSKSFIKNRREFCKNIKIVLGPSLNKQKIFKSSKMSTNYKFVIALCGIKALDEKMISWLYFLINKDDSLRVYLKPHPILPIHKLRNFDIKIFKDRISVLNGNIRNILEKTEILITSGPTSIIYESVVYGCKLFYLYLDPCDKILKSNTSIPKKSFVFIKNKNDFLNQIKRWKEKKHIKVNSNLKNKFYTKINDKNLKIFF